MTTEPRYLLSMSLFPPRLSTHTYTHLTSEADKSKLNDQTLNKDRRTGNDRSPLQDLQTLGAMLCMCVCVRLDWTPLVFTLRSKVQGGSCAL